MPTIPHLIPPVDPVATGPLVDVSPPGLLQNYDVAIGGLGFRYATDVEKPMIWETAPYLRQQVDQAAEAGEQTLSNWWVKSQSSFHGGAGQANLERTDLPAQYTHIRFHQSKNIDCWTPGIVQRLPDTTVLNAATTSRAASFALAGADRLGYIDGTTPKMITTGGTVTTFTGVTEAAYDIVSDGKRVFVAGLSGVWVVDPAAPTLATKIATYPATSTSPVLGWVKARLMLGVASTVFEVDTNPGAPPVALGGTQTRYTHPTTGWQWRCFAESAAVILAAGDAGLFSSIVEFTVGSDGSTPVLVVAATAAELPPGERVLAMQATMGTFLGIGTTAGVRVGQFNDALSNTRLNLGPLTLPTTETQFAVSCLTARDRFLYVGGLAVDEPGLLRIDLGTQTDQAGRFAYATDLIAPVKQSASPVTAVTCLPSGKIVFSAPGSGLCLEGTGAGSGREAWLTTSRIRYNTTEPKLFTLGRVRGTFTSPSACEVEAITRDDSFVCAIVGALLTGESDEFGLPDGGLEWVQLRFTLAGATTQLASYGVKALPGTLRPRRVQVWLQCFDQETDRRGRRSAGSAYDRVAALFELDRQAALVFFEEFAPGGNRKTLMQIEQARFAESTRVTDKSGFGGQLMVLLRTVT